MYGLIYKATNKENSKVYIGKTTRSLQTRKHEHIYDTKMFRNETYFHKAIRKYGDSSFEFEMIDTANNEDELNHKETYWIRKENSCIYSNNCNGYNMTFGGESNDSIWDDDLIIKNVKSIMSKLNKDCFPTKEELRYYNPALESVISKRGGISYWSDFMNLETTFGFVYWDNNSIKNALISFSNMYLDGKHMPTNRQLEEILGNNKLGSAITKTFGFSGWADRLNMKLQDSTSNTWILIRHKLENKLKSIGFDVERMPYKADCSLIINGNIKIFISCSKYLNKRGQNYHKFKIKNAKDDDIHIFCALDNELNIKNLFIIPHRDISHLKNTLDIYKTGKYYKYVDNWDCIKMKTEV